MIVQIFCGLPYEVKLRSFRDLKHDLSKNRDNYKAISFNFIVLVKIKLNFESKELYFLSWHLGVPHIHQNQHEGNPNSENQRHDEDENRNLVASCANFCFGFRQSLMRVVEGNNC